MAVDIGGGPPEGVREPIKEAVHALLRRETDFTALLCVNDFLALDALHALAEAGKRVPEDVSVAGMGGLLPHPLPGTTLTTVVDDYRGIGRAAGELLLKRIEGSRSAGTAAGTADAPARKVERRVLPAQLRIGKSTGRCGAVG
jgi:DNA-binding LacI/PurR family transcriptional regulator